MSRPTEDKGHYFDWEGFASACWNDFTIMQFTGLYDSKGKEIYEGDIVKFTSDFDQDYEGEVVFGSGSFMVIIKNGDIAFTFTHDIHIEEWELEIIGNVYESPTITR